MYAYSAILSDFKHSFQSIVLLSPFNSSFLPNFNIENLMFTRQCSRHHELRKKQRFKKALICLSLYIKKKTHKKKL